MDMIIVAVAAITGGATGAGIVWWQAVKPMQQHLRAAHDSQNDTVYLWRRDQRMLTGDVERAVERARAGEDAAETSAMVADLAIAQGEYQQRMRRQALGSLELVLGYYGREVARADEAEDMVRSLLVRAQAAEAAADEFGGRLQERAA